MAPRRKRLTTEPQPQEAQVEAPAMATAEAEAPAEEKPSLIPVGTQVVLVDAVKSGFLRIPGNTRTVVYGYSFGESGQVYYKVQYRNRYIWVDADKLKTI